MSRLVFGWAPYASLEKEAAPKDPALPVGRPQGGKKGRMISRIHRLDFGLLGQCTPLKSPF
jgi:hypothetical protein